MMIISETTTYKQHGISGIFDFSSPKQSWRHLLLKQDRRKVTMKCEGDYVRSANIDVYCVICYIDNMIS